MPRSQSKPSNAELLTQGESYIRRKRTQAKDQVEKVVFDDSARAEFLTGFHKRKQEKLTQKREKAKERDRLEKAKEKREFRQARKEQAVQNMEAVERAYGLEPSSGMHAGPSTFRSSLPEEAEFSDGEDQVATVTIVEDFDIDTTQPLPFGARSVSPDPSVASRAYAPVVPPKTLKMQSGAKPKNKSGKKTMLRGTEKAMRTKKDALKREGGRRGGHSPANDGIVQPRKNKGKKK